MHCRDVSCPQIYPRGLLPRQLAKRAAPSYPFVLTAVQNVGKEKVSQWSEVTGNLPKPLSQPQPSGYNTALGVPTQAKRRENFPT